MIKNIAVIESVEEKTSKNGKQYATIKDNGGNFYQSWDAGVTRLAKTLTGTLVELSYNETKNGQYTNRSLTGVVEAPSGGNGSSSESTTHTSREVAAPGDSGPAGDNWYEIVRGAALRGEWRAAEALLRRRDINRSVALNNTITFFQYLDAAERKPSNVKLIFEYILKALEEE